MFIILFIIDEPTAKLATFLLTLVENTGLQVIGGLIIQKF